VRLRWISRSIPERSLDDVSRGSGSSFGWASAPRKPLKNRIGQQRNSKPRSLRARWRRTQSLWMSWTPTWVTRGNRDGPAQQRSGQSPNVLAKGFELATQVFTSLEGKGKVCRGAAKRKRRVGFRKISEPQIYPRSGVVIFDEWVLRISISCSLVTDNTGTWWAA
jgi:hypothetical protein